MVCVCVWVCVCVCVSVLPYGCCQDGIECESLVCICVYVCLGICVHCRMAAARPTQGAGVARVCSCVVRVCVCIVVWLLSGLHRV